MSLYKVAAYATSPVWTDVTPGPGHEPAYPYALAVDATNYQKLLMVADDGSTQKRMTSTDQGASWSDHGATPESERGVKISNQIQIIFGTSQIRYSQDNGSSFSSRIGDWSDSIGAPGTILGMWVFL